MSFNLQAMDQWRPWDSAVTRTEQLLQRQLTDSKKAKQRSDYNTSTQQGACWPQSNTKSQGEVRGLRAAPHAATDEARERDPQTYIRTERPFDKSQVRRAALITSYE
jgi:hypothetical protein